MMNQMKAITKTKVLDNKGKILKSGNYFNTLDRKRYNYGIVPVGKIIRN